MPLQNPLVRPVHRIAWHPDPLVVEGHVGLAIVEIVLEPVADEEAAVGGDGDVAGIEEAVDVGAQEEAIVETVLASVSDRPDVGGVQDGEGFLAGHGCR